MQQRIPGDLPALWRERAAFLREYGDPNAARLWELAAIEFERAWQAFDLETLSLTEAARISGYTSDRLGTLVERGIAEARRRCRRLQIACTDRTNATNPVAPIVSSVQTKKEPPAAERIARRGAFPSCARPVYALEFAWDPLVLYPAIQAVADDQARFAVFEPTSGAFFAPYDGGADVFYPSPTAREEALRIFARIRAPGPLGL